MNEIKILIADKIKKQQKLYSNYLKNIDQDILTKVAFNVFIAENGEEAEDLINNEEIDFAIFEEFLPKKKATDILYDKKNINNKFHAIMVTNKGSEELAVKAFRQGFKNYFRRDNFNLEELEKEIKKYIKYLETENLSYFEYEELIEGQEYNFAFIRFDLVRGKNPFSSTHTREELDSIYQNIRNFFERIIKDNYGEIWASKPESYLATFHKGNFIKNAVICAIEIFYGLSLYNLSSRSNVSSNILFKIVVHKGPARFYENQKDIIISKDLNFNAHMTKKTHGYSFVISEDVYKELDEKLKIQFKEAYQFREKQIYNYFF